MKKLKNNSLAILIFCASFIQAHAQELNTKKDSILNEEPIEVIRSFEELIIQINSFEKFTKAFSSLSDGKSQKISYETPFQLEGGDYEKSIQRLKTDPISIENIIKNKTFKYKINNTVIGSIDMSNASYEIEALPLNFYYNGTKTPAPKKADKLEIGHFDNEMPVNRFLDSVDITIKGQRNTAFTTLVLSKEKPMATYNKDTFWFKKFKDNAVGYEFTDHNNPNILQNEGVLNGKIIHSKSSSSGYGKPEELDGFMMKAKMYIERKLTLMKQDSQLSKIDFWAKYKSEVDTIEGFFNSKNGNQYKSMSFVAMPQAIKIHIATQSDNTTFERRLYTLEQSAFIVSENEKDSKFRIYDKLGAVMFEDTIYYSPINNYYFKTEKFYYFFDSKAKKMNRLDAYEVQALTPSKVSVLFDDVEEYYIYGEQGQKLTDTFFESLNSNYKVISALRNKNTWLFIDNQAPKIFEDAHVGDFQHGFALIEKKGKYGVLNTKGQLVVPIAYDYVESFSEYADLTAIDTLFCIKKDDKYGAIDLNGKLIIPMIYDQLDVFSYGVTLAEKNDKKGLINYKNEIIVPFEANSYGQSSNFGIRSYSLNGKTYNHLGKVEIKSVKKNR